MINKLKGGPGQVNRALVEAYLQFKRWGNTPEQWALYALPRDDEAFAGLLNDIMDFERAMMEGERVK